MSETIGSHYCFNRCLAAAIGQQHRPMQARESQRLGKWGGKCTMGVATVRSQWRQLGIWMKLQCTGCGEMQRVDRQECSWHVISSTYTKAIKGLQNEPLSSWISWLCRTGQDVFLETASLHVPCRLQLSISPAVVLQTWPQKIRSQTPLMWMNVGELLQAHQYVTAVDC